jgi:hypothetical protein
MNIKTLILALLLVALSHQALTCNDGYYKMYTRKTYEWANWGPWNCLSVGIPCNAVDGVNGGTITGANAEKYMQKEWLENGGKSWKAWTRNKWCTNETSGSAPWNAARAYSKNQTWRFSKLGKRRILKGRRGGKSSRRILRGRHHQGKSSRRRRPRSN